MGLDAIKEGKSAQRKMRGDVRPNAEAGVRSRRRLLSLSAVAMAALATFLALPMSYWNLRTWWDYASSWRPPWHWELSFPDPPEDTPKRPTKVEARLDAPSDLHARVKGAPDKVGLPKLPLPRLIVKRMKSYPAAYNKPRTLLLGESTPIQIVIATNSKQQIEPYFKGLEGQVIATTARVASEVSAQLTGPADRLEITLRGDKLRTIASPEPITWIWDVKPLRAGNAEVTLEVTSYIKNDKDTEPVPIRVLQDTWFVDARGIEWLNYWAQQLDPIQKFFAGVGVVLGGVLTWFGIKGFRKGKPDLET